MPRVRRLVALVGVLLVCLLSADVGTSWANDACPSGPAFDFTDDDSTGATGAGNIWLDASVTAPCDVTLTRYDGSTATLTADPDAAYEENFGWHHVALTYSGGPYESSSSGGSVVHGGGFSPPSSEVDVGGLVADAALTMKDTLLGIGGVVLPYAAAVLAIGLGWRFGRRFVKP